MEVKWISILTVLAYIISIHCLDNTHNFDSKDSLDRQPRSTISNYYYYYYYAGNIFNETYLTPVSLISYTICYVLCCLPCFFFLCVCIRGISEKRPVQPNPTTTTVHTTYPQPLHPPATEMPKVSFGNYPDFAPPSYASIQEQPYIGFQS